MLGSPAACGNGICETAQGEDCLSCAADCSGIQNRNPRDRFCCGLDNACDDGRCTAQSFQCTDVTQGQTCCGDGICSGLENSANCEKDCGPAPFCGDGICDDGESSCSCSQDCGAPPNSEVLSCNDNIDNDCDTLVDCDDADCFADATCQVPECDNDGICEAGEDCNSCPGDCAGKRNGKPSGRFCCGDGILQNAEGTGAICDNNF